MQWLPSLLIAKVRVRAADQPFFDEGPIVEACSLRKYRSFRKHFVDLAREFESFTHGSKKIAMVHRNWNFKML
ncbi:hypothetical protein ColLi_09040 [Colletotrichum liriopes]|uniref:Uncharacterized protein n=1 Tax=Colletotrichum liriopes TaxID=708192 RepID=A0AA37LVN8_9PEZI|nr:hypothetical protein ColLi_09040 [Colletotrichum liriopes]